MILDEIYIQFESAKFVLEKLKLPTSGLNCLNFRSRIFCYLIQEQDDTCIAIFKSSHFLIVGNFLPPRFEKLFICTDVNFLLKN